VHFPREADTGAGGESREMSTQANSVKRFVAYFSMEIALENAMPSYSGGLGVLAGDTIRAAADLRLPMVAVSLLYRRGFFSQHLSEDGTQTEEPVEWKVEDFLKEENARVSVPLENRRRWPATHASADQQPKISADLLGRDRSPSQSSRHAWRKPTKKAGATAGLFRNDLYSRVSSAQPREHPNRSGN